MLKGLEQGTYVIASDPYWCPRGGAVVPAQGRPGQVLTNALIRDDELGAWFAAKAAESDWQTACAGAAEAGQLDRCERNRVRAPA